ncbi:MAG: efflux RND transporter periplasmic adaptor subunit [Phycisphaeraceae bacterium]|nr:efflux RND transporter periplasmic adaptor subunit [Phycisphaeraceae bacterium]
MWKWIFGLFLVCVLVVAAAVLALATSPGARAWFDSFRPKEKATEVRSAAVTRGVLTRTVNAPGSIEPRTKVQISAQVPARIVALPFREGNRVRKGDVVVRLDARDLAAALESSQAQLRAEEARLAGAVATMDKAETDLKRARDLFASKDFSRSQLDDADSAHRLAKSALDAATHAVEAAKAQIARSQKDFDNTIISAPIDGVIVKLNAEVGELVLVGTLNNPASVIMEIADLGDVLLKARVDETNIAPVAGGQRCRVYINAYVGRVFAGTVERVGLKRLLDTQGTGYFEVEVAVQPPDDLILASGLTASTDIEVQTLRDVLKVPSQAVIDKRIEDLPREVREHPLVDRSRLFTRVVFRLVDGRAVVTPVSIGSSDLTHSVVLAGLEEGQPIITGPYKALLDLKPGALVEPEKPRNAPAPASPDAKAGAAPAAKPASNGPGV